MAMTRRDLLTKIAVGSVSAVAAGMCDWYGADGRGACRRTAEGITSCGWHALRRHALCRLQILRRSLC